MRGKCSPVISYSALEYELGHSANAKFSTQIPHNNTLFIQNFLVLKVLIISIAVSQKSCARYN